jgi:hypothetical protein
MGNNKMFHTGITNSIQGNYTNVKEGDNIGFPYIDELPFHGVYITGDKDNNELLRNTVKMCVNRLHEIGMTNVVSVKDEYNMKLGPDELVYKVLDMFQNCEMKPLAEELVEYVGDSRKFTFELVYKEDYYPVENNYHGNHIYIKLRRYYWLQLDNPLIVGSNNSFNYSELSLGERLLERLNDGLPKSRKGRTIHNYLDDPIYMDPPRLRRSYRYTGPSDMGVPVGLDGEDLDILSVELMEDYYDVCEKIVVDNEDDHPITKKIKETREKFAREWNQNYYYGE